MMLGGRKAPALTQPDPVPLSEAALRRSA
jgi:hypothetical protein